MARGHSSAGRASRLQREGRRFDPDWLHHTNYSITACHESFSGFPRGLNHSWHASHETRMCSLKIRQFVLMSNISASLVFGVAFENQLIEFLYDSKSLGVIWSSE